MFNLFKKKEKKHVVGSPAKGKAVSLKEVNDPTFAEEMLGKGAAVIPEEGKIYAPADGEIGMVFDTLHAISMTTDFGAELLIHVGLDTVMLKGEHYTAHCANGDKVKAGDLLIEFDADAIRAAGYDTVTPVVVCNADDFSEITAKTGAVAELGELLTLKK